MVFKYLFKQFKANPPYCGLNLHLNTASLSSAAISFWEDIIRLQAYHNIETPDTHKYAAYSFKWISKVRPIKFVPDNSDGVDVEQYYIRVNALFAYVCAASFLKCSLPSDAEYASVIYSAAYREIQAEQWSLLFYFMEKANPIDAPK